MPTRSRRPARRILAVLDIGTSKVVCLIAHVDPASGVRIVGLGHQRSKGVKAGVIVDLEDAEAAIRAAVGQAERMAGVTLSQVVVAVSCGRLSSLNFTASTEVEAGLVGADDVARAMHGARAYAERDGRSLVHLNQVGVRLDGAPGAADPRGMAAHRLGIDLHAVTADDAPLCNLTTVIERCFLSVEALVAAPYASALGATSTEERRLGVTVVDIGAGVSQIGVFADGRFVHADSVPLGGHHITYDIARALQTPLAEAERIKALYGTLVGAPSDAHEVISYPLASEEEGAVHSTSKARLGEILRPRVAGLLDVVAERLSRSELASLAGDRVVLTGGGSTLVGIAELAARRLARRVRVAVPVPLSGLPPAVGGPAFATVVGLVGAAVAGDGVVVPHEYEDAHGRGYLSRVGAWLREGF